MKSKIFRLITVVAFIVVFFPALTSQAAAFRQVDAAADSATISWNDTYNKVVQEYHIYINNNSTPVTVSNNTNSYTLDNLQQGCAYSVLVLCEMDGKEYYFDSVSHNYIFVKTKPKQMQEKNYSVTWNKNNSLEIEYLDETAYTVDKNTWYKFIDGVEFQVKNLDGRTKKTVSKAVNGSFYINGASALNSFSVKAPAAVRNKGIKYQLRSYIVLENGKKIYSEWTDTKVLIPQAKITGLDNYGSGEVQVKWNKVDNATGYTLWTTDNGGKTYDKVGTVNKKTTAYTISGLKKGSNYGVLVTAKVKVDGKKYNSQKSYYMYYK